MSNYKLAALKSIGGVTLLFYVAPILLLIIISPSLLPEFVLTLISFLIPLLFVAMVFSDMAGRALYRSKGFAFLYTTLCFLFAAICLFCISIYFFPGTPKDFEALDLYEEINSYLISFIFLGIPGCVVSGIFFIGIAGSAQDSE